MVIECMDFLRALPPLSIFLILGFHCKFRSPFTTIKYIPKIHIRARTVYYSPRARKAADLSNIFNYGDINMFS